MQAKGITLLVLAAVAVAAPDGSAQPVITTQPAGATLEFGQTFTTGVVVSSPDPPIYEWYFNGMSLDGQTSSTLTIPNVQTNHAGDYWVVLTDFDGSVTSRVATLRVVGPGATFTRITNGPVVTDVVRDWSGMWGDYDGDGLFDLVVVGDVSPGTNTQFYHNEGDGEFTRLTNGPMSNATDAVLYGVWADLESDGDLDFFLAGVGETFIYRNQGGGQFKRESAPLEVAVLGDSVSWGDYDGDGFLDAFFGTWLSLVPNGSSLLHNKGDGTFSVVTDQPQCLTISGDETSCWVDYDNDGDLDLFAARPDMAVPTRIYRNDGNGQFVEATPEPLSSQLGNRLGGAWADFDNDGDLDLFVPAWVSNPNCFFINQGCGTFVPWTGQPGSLTNGAASRHAAWGDYDNDGHLDLFVASGAGWPGRLFRNVGDGNFMEIKSVAPARESDGHCPSWADHDNDGDLDLLVIGLDALQNRLYRNDGNTNHWLKVRLKGTQSNSYGVGARVFATATIGGKSSRQMRQITAQTVVQELEAHFGLGDATRVETLRVEWPSGHVTEIHDVASKQILNIIEPPGVKCVGWEGTNMCLAITGNVGERYELCTSTDVALPLTSWECWRTNLQTSRTMLVTNASPLAPQRFHTAIPTP